MLRQLSLKIVAPLLAVLLLGLFLLTRDGDERRTVTAHFPRAVSIFEGSEVRVLGVKIGEVTGVIPEGNSVRVEMEYDASHKLPANAQAAVITPTLVADRFVQITPAYESGEELADGAEIALPQTGVPVELDRIYASLRDLSEALGPNGVNQDGTLNHLLRIGAKNLKGKGALGNRMIRDLSEAAETFGQGSGDLFATVRNLARFTDVLAANDELVTAFLQDLSGVSADLAAERGELQGALAEVAKAVGTVESFVRDNREALSVDLQKLARVSKTIASERESLNTALRVAPVGIGNLNGAFDAVSGSIGSRFAIQPNVADADGLLCSLVQQAQMPQATKALACRIFEQLLEPALAGNRRTAPAADGPARLSREDVNARYSTDTSADLHDLVGGR